MFRTSPIPTSTLQAMQYQSSTMGMDLRTSLVSIHSIMRIFTECTSNFKPSTSEPHRCLHGPCKRSLPLHGIMPTAWCGESKYSRRPVGKSQRRLVQYNHSNGRLGLCSPDSRDGGRGWGEVQNTCNQSYLFTSNPAPT